jgi:hypothetical protein
MCPVVRFIRGRKSVVDKMLRHSGSGFLEWTVASRYLLEGFYSRFTPRHRTNREQRKVSGVMMSLKIC